MALVTKNSTGAFKAKRAVRHMLSTHRKWSAYENTQTHAMCIPGVFWGRLGKPARPAFCPLKKNNKKTKTRPYSLSWRTRFYTGTPLREKVCS